MIVFAHHGAKDFFSVSILRPNGSIPGFVARFSKHKCPHARSAHGLFSHKLPPLFVQKLMLFCRIVTALTFCC